MRRSRGAPPRARSGGEWSVVSDEPQQQPASGDGRRRAARRPSTGPRTPVARRRPTPDAHTPHVAARRSRLAEARRAVVVPTITYPEELPVSARRADIAAAIRDHQVVIVAGETGSGKTTQIPKILLELGRGRDGQIGHTQPRRIAAARSPLSSSLIRSATRRTPAPARRTPTTPQPQSGAFRQRHAGVSCRNAPLRVGVVGDRVGRRRDTERARLPRTAT